MRALALALCAFFATPGCSKIIGIEGVTVSGTKVDASCVTESDMELCTRIADACESHTAIDSCGVQRTVDCGGCAGGQGCVVGTCKTPVCTTLDFASAPLSMFTRAGSQDQIAAVTPDGQVILYLQAALGCSGFQLIVADETPPGSGLFMSHNVTAIFNTLGLFVDGESYAITADGLTIIARSGDRRRLLATKRSAIHTVDFDPASTADFDRLNEQAAAGAGCFGAPTISADGLELFYSFTDATASTSVIYSSVRESTSVPFPAGAPIPAAMQYPRVTGVSSDRLTLFVFDAFSGRVLTRNSTSQPFTNPNAPGAPTLIPNWAHKPLADCSKLVAIASPGGCQNEDIVLMVRQ